ncbi:hypothetical protein D3C73_1622650 [compost metagenome]
MADGVVFVQSIAGYLLDISEVTGIPIGHIFTGSGIPAAVEAESEAKGFALTGRRLHNQGSYPAQSILGRLANCRL